MSVPKVGIGMFLARHRTGLQNGGPLFSTFREQDEKFYCGNDGNWIRVTPEEAKLLSTPAQSPVVNNPGATPAPAVTLQSRFLSGESLSVRDLQLLADDLNINPGQKKADLLAAITTALQA